MEANITLTPKVNKLPKKTALHQSLGSSTLCSDFLAFRCSKMLCFSPVMLHVSKLTTSTTCSYYAQLQWSWQTCSNASLLASVFNVGGNFKLSGKLRRLGGSWSFQCRHNRMRFLSSFGLRSWITGAVNIWHHYYPHGSCSSKLLVL